MISDEILDSLKQDINIRDILDDFSVPRTNNNCRCPFPLHNDVHFSAIIHDAGWDRNHSKYYDHPSVYCVVDQIRWDNIELYAILKDYNYKKDFVKIIEEMVERYLSGKHIEEIRNNKAKETSEKSKTPKFNSFEEEQEFINNLLNNKNPEYLVTEYALLNNKYGGNNYLNQYFKNRGFNDGTISSILSKSNIEIYHSYDRNYKSNAIYYVLPINKGKSIIKKRIDAYLDKNLKRKNEIRKFKMNIGQMEPILLHRTKQIDSKKFLIICEGIEDAISALLMAEYADVISLNSTKLISHFKNWFEQHEEEYKGFNILLALDNDNQGIKETISLLQWFKKKNYVINTDLFTYKYVYKNTKDINDEYLAHKEKREQR